MDGSNWPAGGPDFSEEYRQQARQLAKRFAIMEGVVGVVLVGGLTFGEGDRHSDVDLIVYLQQQSLRTWYFGEAPLPEGESRYHNLRLDTSYRDFRAEQERLWTPAEIWKVSRAEILYDPEGLLQHLIESKTGASSYDYDYAALDQATTVRFLLGRTVAAWLYRGEILAAHHVLNHAIDQFVGLLHYMNHRAMPGADWNVALLNNLEWTPERLPERLTETLTVRELTSAEASRRRYALHSLLRECWERIAPNEPFEDRTDAVEQARMLRTMVKRKRMSLEQYEDAFDRRLLIMSPAYELLSVDRQETGTYIQFNDDRLGRLIEHELGRFLDYQQRLLRELAATSGSEVDG